MVPRFGAWNGSSLVNGQNEKPNKFTKLAHALFLAGQISCNSYSQISYPNKLISYPNKLISYPNREQLSTLSMRGSTEAGKTSLLNRASSIGLKSS